MKKAIAIMSLFTILFLVGCSEEERVNPEVIKIEAILKLNDNKRVNHKDYVLEIIIDKDFGHNMIYPYMMGLHYNMTYDSNEKDGYYVPSSMGTTESDKKMVVDTLKENDIDSMTDVFIGFNVPEEPGKYKVRMYFQEGEGFAGFNDFHLIYLNKEEGNYWTKLIEVDLEIE